MKGTESSVHGPLSLPCNRGDQDPGHSFHHPKRFPVSGRPGDWPAFHHHRCYLSSLKFHIHDTIYDDAFCVCLCLLSRRFWDSPRWASQLFFPPFLWLARMPLQEEATILFIQVSRCSFGLFSGLAIVNKSYWEKFQQKSLCERSGFGERSGKLWRMFAVATWRLPWTGKRWSRMPLFSVSWRVTALKLDAFQRSLPLGACCRCSLESALVWFGIEPTVGGLAYRKVCALGFLLRASGIAWQHYPACVGMVKLPERDLLEVTAPGRETLGTMPFVTSQAGHLCDLECPGPTGSPWGTVLWHWFGRLQDPTHTWCQEPLYPITDGSSSLLEEGWKGWGQKDVGTRGEGRRACSGRGQELWDSGD